MDEVRRQEPDEPDEPDEPGGGLVLARGAVAHVARTRGGTRTKLRRGAYVDAAQWERLTSDERHLAHVRAVVADAVSDVVVSHWSAALAWRLPVVGQHDDRVHLTARPSSGGRTRGDVVRHCVTDMPTGVLQAGLMVTSPARTVVDLARVGGIAAGLVAGDAAVRCGLTDADELMAHARRAGRGRGSRAARLVAAAVDPLAESPGESLSRARMIEHGLPLPVLQHEVRDRDGFVGRVDFWWPHVRVVGEFDGRVKYGDAQGADALWREKLREDRLRAVARTVVRWTWDDAWRAFPLVDRLYAAGVPLTPIATATQRTRAHPS